jgi:hypothetical protein
MRRGRLMPVNRRDGRVYACTFENFGVIHGEPADE